MQSSTVKCVAKMYASENTTINNYVVVKPYVYTHFIKQQTYTHVYYSRVPHMVHLTFG